jgi:hypothetical protein
MKVLRRCALAFAAAVLTGPLVVACSGTLTLNGDWRTADRSPAGIAPDPARVKEAVVQVYAARAFNWRGIFGVHTWIATKRANAAGYEVHQVVGWRRYSGLPVLVSEPDAPDRLWYGYAPEILVDLRGPEAEAAIDAILAAVRSYPFPETYRVWPGPNSNTFTAWVGRQVPALRLDLPPTAIGKDYLGGLRLIDRAPSGSGWQFSLFGLLGATVALEEGVEVNLLGLSAGLNPLDLEVRLPGLGILRPGNPATTITE